MDISKRDLELFLALADTSSFTRAAGRCHLSQSAFSSRIRLLEQGLGVTLFDRTTRAVELTGEGRLFEASARRLHRELSDVVSDFRDHAARRRGRVRIAALPAICAAWLPGVLVEFRKKYPDIELSLIDGLSQHSLEQLRTGEVDLAITAATEAGEDLHATQIGTDQFRLVCLKDHPLAAREIIRAEDLLDHPFLHVARSSSVRQHIDAALDPITLTARIEVQHMSTIAGMVEAGLGISLVPGISLWQFRRPTITSRPVAIPNLSRSIHIFKRHGYTLSPAAQALYEHALEHRKSLEALAKSGD